jgi:LysM repeat protein
VTDQKLFTLGRGTGNVRQKWQSHPIPGGNPLRPVRIRMMRTVAAAICMTALLVTGCEYAPQPSNPAKETASASASTSPSPAGVAGSLNGKTELNKFFLATQYTCVDGDTWETIAREFGIKADILKTFNKSATLRAGTVIDVRGRDVPQLGARGPYVPNPDGTATYTVQAEDTFLGIGSRFGVPGYALRGANTELRGNGGELLVAPGQKLTIPSTL